MEAWTNNCENSWQGCFNNQVDYLKKIRCYNPHSQAMWSCGLGMRIEQPLQTTIYFMPQIKPDWAKTIQTQRERGLNNRGALEEVTTVLTWAASSPTASPGSANALRHLNCTRFWNFSGVNFSDLQKYTINWQHGWNVTVEFTFMNSVMWSKYATE